MTWPGLRPWQPYLGLVVWLPRDYYDEHDTHAGRPTVVVRVLQIERTCIVVTRTSQTGSKHRDDIFHPADPALTCCDEPGLWQPWRWHRVAFGAYDDDELDELEKMDELLLTRIIDAYERCS